MEYDQRNALKILTDEERSIFRDKASHQPAHIRQVADHLKALALDKYLLALRRRLER